MALNRFRVLSALILALSSLSADYVAVAAPGVATNGITTDVTNYSSSGTTRGRLGYWFANFDAKVSSKLQPVTTNLVDELPDWMLVDYDTGSPTYSFALDSPSSAFSTGGQGTYNNFTLPNGQSGLSGQLVDDMNTTGTQSNTIITGFGFTADAPTAILVSIVMDNAPTSELTSVSRLRMRLLSPGGAIEANAQYDNLFTGATHNGTADVYQFLLTGIEANGFMAVQLRSPGFPSVTGADAALAGVMIDPVKNGDFNLNQIVDGGDYTIWADNYLETGVGYTGGDANINGIVDGGDYTVWADNYNPTPAFASAAAVPEPSTIALMVIGAAVLGARWGLQWRSKSSRP